MGGKEDEVDHRGILKKGGKKDPTSYELLEQAATSATLALQRLL